MIYSDLKVGDAVVRRWNNQVYYICHDVDTEKWEFMIDKVKNQKFSKCKICECYSNLRIASQEEIDSGYAENF